MNKTRSKITFCLLVTGGFFIWPDFSLGATNDVVINEIAWMGTDVSSADEWVAPQKDILKQSLRQS